MSEPVEPMTDPRRGQPSSSSGRAFGLVTAWLFPILTVVFGAAMYLLGSR